MAHEDLPTLGEYLADLHGWLTSVAWRLPSLDSLEYEAREFFSVDREEGMAPQEMPVEMLDAVARDVRRVFVARAADWPCPSDLQRLTRAFERLETEHRILAPTEPTECCGLCLSAAMHERVNEQYAVGFVGFHSQDIQDCDGGKPIFLGLSYGAADEEDTRWVAEKVVAALWDVGLTARWDGDPRRRMEILNFRWFPALGVKSS